MKTLLVSQYFWPEIGAAPSRLTNMAKGLAEHGDVVDVLTALPNYPKGKIFEGYRHKFSYKERIGKCTVFRYWTLAMVTKNPVLRGLSLIVFSVVLWCFAFHVARIKSYDRVIIQSPPLPVAGSAMLLFKCLYGKKVYLNVSDLWPLSAVELGAMRPGSLIHKVFCKIERFLYRKADGILGQSQEILEHIKQFPNKGKMAVYRNLQRYDVKHEPHAKPATVKVVYAGLLGVAQDLLGILQHIDFKALGMELHLYGGGAQKEKITEYIAAHDCGVFYHGFVTKEQITGELLKYDASLIPLAVRIKGAVPSKIFDILPMGIPVVFCGGGEGAKIVESYKVGFTSEPGNYDALAENLQRLAKMPADEYTAMSERCLHASNNDFDFDKQMENILNFLYL